MSKVKLSVVLVLNACFLIGVLIYIQIFKTNYKNKINKKFDKEIGEHIKTTVDVFKQENYELTIKEKLIKHYDLDKHKAAIFASIINASSERFNVEWERLAAKTKVESNFDFYAKSKATKIFAKEPKQSAYGLLQIKPTTGNECERELNEDWHGLHSLYNPVTNIYLGSYYYAKLSIIFDGDFEKSEKAYNVGLGGFYKGHSSERHWKKVLLEYKRLKNEDITDLENEIKKLKDLDLTEGFKVVSNEDIYE